MVDEHGRKKEPDLVIDRHFTEHKNNFGTDILLGLRYLKVRYERRCSQVFSYGLLFAWYYPPRDNLMGNFCGTQLAPFVRYYNNEHIYLQFSLIAGRFSRDFNYTHDEVHSTYNSIWNTWDQTHTYTHYRQRLDFYSGGGGIAFGVVQPLGKPKRWWVDCSLGFKVSPMIPKPDEVIKVNNISYELDAEVIGPAVSGNGLFTYFTSFIGLYYSF